MKKRTIRISESELIKIISEVIKEQNQLNENIFNKITDPIKNVYHGLKGAVKTGHGYQYMRYASELSNLTRDLKKFDIPNEKIMIRLKNMYTEVQSLNMRQDLKDNILNGIKGAYTSFKAYTNYIDSLSKAVTKRLS